MKRFIRVFLVVAVGFLLFVAAGCGAKREPQAVDHTRQRSGDETPPPATSQNPARRSGRPPALPYPAAGKSIGTMPTN